MSAAKFEKAVSIVNGLPKDGPVQPTQDERLTFYSLYKQATVGDNTTTRPGTFSLDLVGKAKWDAWDGQKGKSTEDAQKEYVDALIATLTKEGGDDAQKYLKELEAA
ncbi:hypothetical protein FRB99_002917 [Tulasnella sp. 403]|nr:hypothetical protein FRB99_002917 [Tulasnella sp. 403]